MRTAGIRYVFFLLGLLSTTVHAQTSVWISDQGNGTYKNPVLHADYSDPDAIRVGDDFFMTASSFDAVPGLPILHSKDLINWTLIGHALRRLFPVDHFSKTQHGNGVWAPAIRHYNNEFYIYYPDPDVGIYLTKAKQAAGPWSDPALILAGKGLIDPCPFWDENGKTYLIHAYAGSRAGIKSILVIRELNKIGDSVLNEGTVVYDGHATDPTIEGPKLYKRNGYYYIFAPAGGVSTGWQVVLRSKNIYGPYERRVVMDQGSTQINGPHQGAWVSTQTGEDWFLHFQDKEAYGRVVHLQPMKWISDWPVIGNDKDGDGTGEPVLHFKKPDVGKIYPVATISESDEFNSTPGLQWQWQANPQATWAFSNQAEGTLRLYSQKIPDQAKNLWDAPNVLLQKFPAEEFIVTTKLSFTPNAKLENEKAGLVIMGLNYASLALKNSKDGTQLIYSVCNLSDKDSVETESVLANTKSTTFYFRVTVQRNAVCLFSYSTDGKKFIQIDQTFKAISGRWIGAKVGLFCTRISQTNDSGYADIDWFRFETLK